ncbi:MAG: FAD:protein FMN transferase, partial [Candidatus Dormiibacterota bacterium]
MGPDLGVRVWSALGTRAELLITDPERLPAAEAAVDDLLREIDEACSRFRANSELSRVNHRAGRDLRVSPLLGAALAAALRGAVMTGGAVDPTVGTAMRQIGYDRDFADVLAEEGPIELRARPVPGWQVIEFDPLSLHLRVPRGVELDLGSTAKALAADLAAEAVR